MRLTLGGVGGAFGAREDVSLHIHSCLLALHTGRPVKMVYSRKESFLGHVHRHPARIWMRHSADPDGTLVSFETRIVLDGGAYRSSSLHVTANAACFSAGPYRVPNALVEAFGVRTNNPPCGAMRGFGAVQVAFAHEAQMDLLAAACDVDPVELRLRNALAPGDELLTGQRIDGTLPVADVIRACAALRCRTRPSTTCWRRPGGAGRTADAVDVRRGVGFAVGFKNLMYAEGYDDYSTARCRSTDGVATDHVCGGRGRAGLRHPGAAVCAHHPRRRRCDRGARRHVDRVGRLHVGESSDDDVGRRGGAGVPRARACSRVRHEQFRAGELDIVDGASPRRHRRPPWSSFPGETFDRGVPPPVTHPLDADGQGDAHVSFACAAHRAVVDVDPELGLVRVVHLATAQDVGKVLNPLQVARPDRGRHRAGCRAGGDGGAARRGGLVRNASFTDYLIPTALDAPTVDVALIEEPEPGAPFGAKGVGEPPTISSTPAVVAAIRAATGAPLTRVPVRPRDIVQ